MLKHRFARGSFQQEITSEFFMLAMFDCDQGLKAHLVQLGLRMGALEEEVLSEGDSDLPIAEPLSKIDASEIISVGRVVDANANRARESLRVLEDYARFILEDAFITSELKRLRHAFAEAFNYFPPRLLLEGRETQQDVGTVITAEGEMERLTAGHVAQVNAKRLQESLRGLEEFSKISAPLAAELIEKIRYEAYTLERALLLGADARHRLADTQLQVLLTGKSSNASLDWIIKEAAAGGADVFQLREEGPYRPQAVGARPRGAPLDEEGRQLFIVNDRPDIARLAEADGVHLGQDDLSPHDGRRILGPDALIGVSTHNIEQVHRAIRDGASYIGVGPAFRSKTKDFEQLAGLEFVKAVAAETTLPAFVIGGVNEETIGQVVEAGGKRVAVSGAILQAEEPRQAALLIRSVLR